METITFKKDLTQKEAFTFKSFLIEKVKENSEVFVDVSECKNFDLVGVNALAMGFLKAEELNHKIVFKLKKESSLFELLELTKFNKILNFVFA